MNIALHRSENIWKIHIRLIRLPCRTTDHPFALQADTRIWFVHSLLYKAVKGNANDKHFNLYHDEECKEAADIELCIPVKKEIHHPLLTCRYLEKLHALHTAHIYGYYCLWIAWKLFAYAMTKEFILTTIRRGLREGTGNAVSYW